MGTLADLHVRPDLRTGSDRRPRGDPHGADDLHAFAGLSDAERPGYREITVNYRVQADAPPEKIDELCAYVQQTSPVLDIIRNPVPVTVRRIP